MKNILLIEDDPFLVDIYTAKLKEAGFNVEVATDGEQGLTVLAEKKFDLLVLDIVLPQIDGWEILEKIKKQKTELIKSGWKEDEAGFQQAPVVKNLKNLKIIILSNLGQKEEVEKGIEKGALKYLIKAHYAPTEVIREIKKILDNIE